MMRPTGKKAWRKSSVSGDGGCVEVADLGSLIGMRDSKAGGAGLVLTFDRERWAEFLAGVRAGEFDRDRMSD
jgi:hypothetical protein